MLRIVATYPGSGKYLAAFAKQTCNGLLASSEKGQEFECAMKRKEALPAPDTTCPRAGRVVYGRAGSLRDVSHRLREESLVAIGL